MLKQQLIILLLDFILIWFWVQSIHPEPSISIALIIFIPVIIVINIIAGFVLIIFKSKWSNSLFINTIFSPIIFYFFFTTAIQKGIDDNYKSFYFQKDNKNFEITFKVNNGKVSDSLFYDFYGLGDGSSWTIGISGHYRINKDTILMWTDSGRLMKMYNLILFDYPKKGDTIKIRTR